MDLTLADQVVFDQDYRNHMPFASLLVDPYDQRTIDPMFSKAVRLPAHIPPHTRALLSTLDEVDIPANHIGIIGLRSSWARFGFMSPMTIADPGFKGTLTMELWNASPQKILVRPGDKVWTMHLVPVVDEGLYEGRYQGQTGLQLPRALTEPSAEAPKLHVVEDPRDIRT